MKALRGYLVGLILLAACVGGILGQLAAIRWKHAGVISAPTMAAFIPIGFLMVGFLIQGSTEELLLRGWFMQLIASRHGILLAIALQALIFSALHAGNLKPVNELYLGLLNIVLVAIFLAQYAIAEGSLWGACAWHGAWNWLLGLGFGLEVSGMKMGVDPLLIDLADAKGAPWWLTGASFGPEASVVTTGVLLLGIIYFMIFKPDNRAV